MKVTDLISLLEKFDGSDSVIINDTNGKEWTVVEVYQDLSSHTDVVWLEVE